jgi:chemotaxis protein methyltransferase CheR
LIRASLRGFNTMEHVNCTPELTDRQFRRISHLVHEQCGINLLAGKEALVRSRLARRLQALGLGNFDSYVDIVEDQVSGAELRAMIDALTTNKTSFFREPEHFEYLRNRVLSHRSGEPMRFWSAGCATGEEPYTLAIVLADELPESERGACRILATDLSDRALSQAREGVYEADRLEEVPEVSIKRYFTPVTERQRTVYAVSSVIRSMVRFARLNLMDDWPMNGPFDIIFCRNVMIYFDLPTRKNLVRRFWRLLRPGGRLFVGHSESLTQSSPEFSYVQPAVYVRRAI